MKRNFFVRMTAVMLAAVMVLSMSVTYAAEFKKVNTYANNFSDVAASAWYAENVKTAYELGFMNGKSEGKFDPNGNVTVAEGVTMAARLNAIYNGVDLENYAAGNLERRFDFDEKDPSVSFGYFDGKFENGMIVGNSKPRSTGVHDPQIYLNNIQINASEYGKIIVRMKRDALPNPSGGRSEWCEVFFTHDVAMSEAKCVKYVIKQNLDDWADIEIDLASHKEWKGIVKGVRFDPTNNNGYYYIDSISFVKSDNAKEGPWYQKYSGYAMEKGIISESKFTNEDYSKNISRAELCTLFAAALPEETFNIINEIKGIPDMDKQNEYYDIILMLYKAGIVLGDAEGNFNPYSDIKRSEVAAIINRVALPENRVKGTVDPKWPEGEYLYDVEFDSEADLERAVPGPRDCDEVKVENGILSFKVKDRGENSTGLRYDPKITFNNLKIDADEYPIIRVRMKIDFIGDVSNTKCDIYYTNPEDEAFSEKKSYHPNLFSSYYTDALGWMVIDIDMVAARTWLGEISSLRFDPTNNNGVYYIDYVRFIRSERGRKISDAELEANYTARTVYLDQDYEKGFTVSEPGDRIKQVGGKQEGVWQPTGSAETPVWEIGPYWTDTFFLRDRDTTTDKFTLKDKEGIKSVTYNPETKSVRFYLDGAKIFKGEPCVKEQKWPHLLLQQNLYGDDYSKVPEELKPTLELNADKIYVEMDVILHDYKASAQPEGLNMAALLGFFYFAHKDIPGYHTYFGVEPFNRQGMYQGQYLFVKDSHSPMMIYNLSQECIFDNDINKSFYRADGNHVMGEWKTIRADITPHIDNMIRKANEENAYGREVTLEDFWISGMNIGYEIRGNEMLDMEFKNVRLICYDKK